MSYMPYSQKVHLLAAFSKTLPWVCCMLIASATWRFFRFLNNSLYMFSTSCESIPCHLSNISCTCALLLTLYPGTSTTAILAFAFLIVSKNVSLQFSSWCGWHKNHRLILLHLFPLILLSSSLSTLLHSLGLYSSSSPCSSFSIVLL